MALKLDKEWRTGGHFSIMLWYARLGHDPDWFKQHVDVEARPQCSRTDVAVRVVPIGAGGHPGMDGAFKIMTTESGDVAFADSPGGGRLVPVAAEVRSYVLRYDRVGQQAMSEFPSRERIKQAMEAMQ
ncbi:Scr1 family TA system antitoxin-like transcriptional regulator [Actinomadura sp. DC4]|uniref:Scr1 family TA system antitoxin-like transcriptional regulator n=1 Tax=Actinomadura sp. DC4 TaxID=3055069 RepID=UPI0025B1B085|nr:Scr1 family TA system antitoxin-like transcriptional regulator [Actinomadura sp. DC4]MDN3352948.1 Scr1 family TA system antitoxin-like transcriptional regulator [Actinomadura sp. DC4]